MDKNKKDNGNMSIGILYLDEPCFEESREYFMDLGFQVHILTLGYPTTKLIDFLHVPDFAGFDTLSLGFRGYKVLPKCLPCSNEVRYFFDEEYKYYVNADKPLIAFGHPFYTAAAKLKNGDSPLFKLEMSEGQVRFESPIHNMARHDTDGVSIIDSRIIGRERFGLTDVMLEFMKNHTRNFDSIAVITLS